MPDFKKYYTITALPEEVFAGLTFKPTIELWTGFSAEFKLEKGAEFFMIALFIVSRANKV